MDLFRTYRRNAPPGIIPVGGNTVQGVYCMTADGEFLSGYFAWAFRDKAKRVIEDGWDQFEQLASRNGWNPEPVPTNKLAHTLGEQVERGGMKLQVAVRDLPRGNVQRPGTNAFQRDAHNLSWIDLTASEVSSMVTESPDKKRLPVSVLMKLSKALKDCVRGQCGDWDKNSKRDGNLYVQCIDNDASHLTIRITGEGDFAGGGRSYLCQLHGRARYNKQSRSFEDLTLVASGQRTGMSGANDRKNDLGPAPMGVAFRLYQ